jgi:hypothetical protein
MAKTTAKTKRNIQGNKKQRKTKVGWKFPLHKQNYLLLGLGLAVILIGYALMATGITEEAAVPDGKWNNPFAVTIAPILLIIGYCVIIPFAILKYFGSDNESEQN